MFSTWSCILFFYVNIATVIYKKENITRWSSFHSIYSSYENVNEHWSVPPISKVGKSPSTWHLLAAISKEENVRFNFKMNFSFLVKNDSIRSNRISDISSYYNFQTIRFSFVEGILIERGSTGNRFTNSSRCSSKFYLKSPIIYVEKFSILVQWKMNMKWNGTMKTNVYEYLRGGSET